VAIDHAAACSGAVMNRMSFTAAAFSSSVASLKM
jgi:hypothetical protein